jgi:hypothetical protein
MARVLRSAIGALTGWAVVRAPSLAASVIDVPDAAVAAPGRRPRARSAPRRRLVGGISSAVVWAGFLAAAGILTYAYARAAHDVRQPAPFDIFWVGVLVFFVPAALRLCSPRTSRNERFALIGAAALLFYLPKFLRDPGYPVFFDEAAHWRQSELIYQHGTLFIPNPVVRFAEFFPGLHTLTVCLRELTGMTTWQLAVALIALFHVLAALGIFLLGERITGSARAGGLAALVYALNSSFMFFDSQYAYESMAIPLFIWATLAVLRVQDSGDSRGRQAGWFIAAIVLGLACVVTHHLTSYFLVGLLTIVCGVSVVRALMRRESPGTTALTISLTTVIGAAALAWMLFVAPSVTGYLSPKLSGGLTEINRLLNHTQGSRKLFAQSTTPGYEQRSAFLAPLVAGLGALTGLIVLRRRLLRLSAALGVVLFGLLYFPSIPFILTSAGAEGARRSWAFTYVGIAILVGGSIPWILRAAARSRVLRAGALGGIVALLCVLLVGNVSMGQNVEYRFPGAFVYGSDTRTLTPDLLGAVRWFRATYGTNQRMVADRDAGMAFGAFGFDWIEKAWSGFPLWDFYFQAQAPRPALFQSLEFVGTRFIVVDRRMGTNVPRTGVYMVPEEPQAHNRVKPVGTAAIAKFEHAPWVTKVFQSGDLSIYRFDLPARGICTDQGDVRCKVGR